VNWGGARELVAPPTPSLSSQYASTVMGIPEILSHPVSPNGVPASSLAVSVAARLVLLPLTTGGGPTAESRVVKGDANLRLGQRLESVEGWVPQVRAGGECISPSGWTRSS
jgi:hypothetical protein